MVTKTVPGCQKTKTLFLSTVLRRNTISGVLLAYFCDKFRDIFTVTFPTCQKYALERSLGSTGCRNSARIKFFRSVFGASLGHEIRPFRHPNFPFSSKCRPKGTLAAFGTLLARSWEHFGRLWSQFCPLFGAQLLPFQPAFDCFRASPVVRILSSSHGLLIQSILIFASFRSHLRSIPARLEFNFWWTSAAFP